jgi:hypothetical protein
MSVDPCWLNTDALIGELRHLGLNGRPQQVAVASADRLRELLRAQTCSDAARWQSLLSSPRIRVIGTSGFDKPAEDYRHFGVEFWSHYPPPVTTNTASRTILTSYADHLIKLRG